MYKHTPSAPCFNHFKNYTYKQIKNYYLKQFDKLKIIEVDLSDLDTIGFHLEKSGKMIICIEDALQDFQKKEILLHEIGHLHFGIDEAYAEKFRSYRLLDLDTFCIDLLKGRSLETCAEHQGMELYDFIAHFENIKKEPYYFDKYRFCFEPFSVYDTENQEYITIDIEE